MAKLLLDEPPLVVLPQLAVRIGLNEAIILQQIHYWLQAAQIGKRMNLFKNDRWWVSFSAVEWAKQFPFWSPKTVKRTFTMLETRGLIIAEPLSDNTWDRTNWYTIDYTLYDQLVSDPEPPEEGTPPEEQEAPEPGENALGHSDPMHWVNLTQCIGSNCPDPLGQNDPIDWVKLTQSLKEETKKRISIETTTTRTPRSLFEDDPPTDPVVVVADAERELTDALVEAGVGRIAAQRLAQRHPDEARRQLAFLPFVTGFKTSRGAYLRKAIEEGFGPPPGWEAAQAKNQKQATIERQKLVQKTRDREEEERRRRIDALKQSVRETDPGAWEALQKRAEQSLPPPIRSRPDGPGYRGAMEHKIEELLTHLYPPGL